MANEDLKEKYKGISLKEKGFYEIDKTQLIFKSELKQKKKLGFIIYNEVYLLQDPLRNQLQMIANGEKKDIPSGITYENERFKVPIDYLNKIVEGSKDEPVEPLPVKQEKLEVGTYNSGSYQIPLLNTVAQKASQYHILESMDFYTSALLDKEDIADQMTFLLEEYIKSSEEQHLVNLILAGILYQKSVKNGTN